MKYKHIISFTASTLITQYNFIKDNMRIVFFDLDNPNLVAIATKENIDEVVKQLTLTKNIVFRIYDTIDLSKSMTEK